MVTKLLDLIYTKGMWIWGYWWSIPRTEIEYYIKNNLDLSYTFIIREFLDSFEYRYGERELFWEITKEHRKIEKFFNKTNLNKDYYWFKPLHELIEEIEKIKTERKTAKLNKKLSAKNLKNEV